MFNIPITELAGKTIEKVEVFSDLVQITFTDGIGAAVVVNTDGALHLRVGQHFAGGGPAPVRVYPGMFASGRERT
jgi:hypothetical protein